MRATPATRSVPSDKSPATITARPPNCFDGLFDPLVVGGDQDLRHGTTGRRLFIHMLDHRLPTEHDEGFSWKARRPVPGRDHHRHGSVSALVIAQRLRQAACAERVAVPTMPTTMPAAWLAKRRRISHRGAGRQRQGQGPDHRIARTGDIVDLPGLCGNVPGDVLCLRTNSSLFRRA